MAADLEVEEGIFESGHGCRCRMVAGCRGVGRVVVGGDGADV